jgi:(S)-2-hydroxyglutarate dehydrogenase
MERIAVVGGGILGVAVARELQLRRPGVVVTVLEKEQALGQHQTGRNSGVVHAGIYYTPGSLKARLCVEGAARMREYVAEHRLPYEECGKLIVALDQTQVQRLDELERRARANGLTGVRRVAGAAEIQDLEPHAAGVEGLHSPHTGITDFAAVTRTMAGEVTAQGGEVRTGAEVVGVTTRGDGVELRLRDGAPIRADAVVACAGLQSDRFAGFTGDAPEPRIVPFRGGYHALRPERRGLVRGLIYPVPDPRFPFLGIHLTKRVDGEVLVGPHAVLALGRERYGRRAAPDLRDLGATLAWPGTARLAARHWRTGLLEMHRTVSTKAFVEEARRYVPELRRTDVVPAVSGIRAQALRRDGSLEDDFVITRSGPVTHVRNAPSPAATSSLAIAAHVVDDLVGAL